MLDLLRWPTRIESHDAREQLDELRASALRLLLYLTTAAYVVWHIANTALYSIADMRRAFTLLPIVALVLGAVWFLAPRSLRAAALVFTGGGLLAITWALVVLESSQAAMLYPLVALVATFVLNPLVGMVSAILSASLVAVVGALRPGLVGTAEVWTVLIFSLLSVGGVWALLRQTVLALNWYVSSYAAAERRTREAEQHRAELVESWRQLDVAYNRLERLNGELQRARRSADEARELKARFAAFISHELRTPLNLVVGFSEMMMTNPRAYGGQSLPVPYRQHLEAVYRNACGLSRLVDDVLDLSQIEAHRMALERANASLAKIVAEAVATVASLYEQLGLTLTVEIPEDLPELRVDANRIRQILVNLLNNAARFTDSGGVVIRASCDEREVEVAVADTGSGIAPDDLPHVFDAFSQSGPPERRRHGSGLGLAICQRFAEMHGGSMRIESQIGRGSTFYLSLPLHDNVATEPLSRIRGPRSEGLRTVAVLDRTPETVHIFQRYLDGYEIVWAANPEDLDRLSGERPLSALVLTGSERDARWRPAIASAPALRGLPVFRCALRTTRMMAKDLGVDAYLLKPVGREHLLSTLRRVGRGAQEILVVEDDPEMATLLVEMIRSGSRRYRLRQAADGVEALALLREKPADLICLDLMLPKLDGYAVVREIRSDTTLRATPLVVISATGTHDETIRAEDMVITRSGGLSVGELVGCLRASLDVLPGSSDSDRPRS